MGYTVASVLSCCLSLLLRLGSESDMTSTDSTNEGENGLVTAVDWQLTA